jgi:hypothetical protein
MGTVEGAQALGLENWPETGVDVGHACLAGVARDEFEAALVFGCSADVFV